MPPPGRAVAIIWTTTVPRYPLPGKINSPYVVGAVAAIAVDVEDGAIVVEDACWVVCVAICEVGCAVVVVCVASRVEELEGSAMVVDGTSIVTVDTYSVATYVVVCIVIVWYRPAAPWSRPAKEPG